LFNNKTSIGNFQSFYYWSSTEGPIITNTNTTNAYDLSFSNGIMYNSGKLNSNRFVRAVRNF
jgi:hypothetical protein